jgi:hypothetical protein
MIYLWNTAGAERRRKAAAMHLPCAKPMNLLPLRDVHPDGKSMNVCDGLRRLFPGRPAPDPNGCRRVYIDLQPTAHHFEHMHCIRVQVYCGEFPSFARNLGTEETLGSTGTTMQVAEQYFYYDCAHPSAVILPMVKSETATAHPAAELAGHPRRRRIKMETGS